ncbi:pimelyl-ACP methyl ester esterase BioV [Arcobacter sp. LA11]|uniref:pimelyl-ACP methyl ester esterase BioV n=1 Tax=Arcobacter sp. LA11 TaxID=1898176 RepID=UPI0009355CCF|nr:pimelyl-ACP methyl ester esterase BioV [Arcobacter sp. LA11]
MISKYFSGFSLENEEELFSKYIIENDFTISGFSYGAIKAFEYVLETQKRVDTLQLFSPAFFQIEDEKFKRMQLMFFKKDTKSYCDNFLKNITYSETINTSNYFTQGTLEELDELLNYTWDDEKLNEIIDRGIKIEIYLGGKDKIINSNAAKEFFKNYGTVYFIKEKGHIL